ncbi:hypothetical protein ACRRTK_023032 [Alexandromys fortis]
MDNLARPFSRPRKDTLSWQMNNIVDKPFTPSLNAVSQLLLPPADPPISHGREAAPCCVC